MNNFENYPEEEVVFSSDEKYTAADKKGFVLIAVLAVVALMFLFSIINRKDAPAVQVTEPDSVQQTVATTPATTQAATVPSTVAPTVTTAAPTTSVQTTAPVKTTSSVQTTAAATTEKAEPSTEEILAQINKGINSLKSDTASFKANKKQIISIDLLDCSVPALTGAINMVIDFFEGEETAEYDVTNGKAPDPEKSGAEIVVNHEIPPTDKPFSLTAEGVAEAKAEKTDKGTLYSVKVVPETSTLENPRPPHHNAACDTLDFSAFELPVGELTKVDFEYPGATVSVLVDSTGKAVQYRERLEIKGTGEGGAFGITGSGTMEGYIEETWDIQWK